MCMSKSEGHGSFFRLQESEMCDTISLKIGEKLAASLNMGQSRTRQVRDLITFVFAT